MLTSLFPCSYVELCFNPIQDLCPIKSLTDLRKVSVCAQHENPTFSDFGNCSCGEGNFSMVLPFSKFSHGWTKVLTDQSLHPFAMENVNGQSS